MGRDTFDWDDEDDDFDGDDRSQSRSSNKEVPDLRKAYNALKRQYKDLESKYNDASKGLRERSVKDVLAAKGLNPKIAGFIPETVTSEDEVAAWVDQFGDVFGTPNPDPAPPADEDLGNNPEFAALARIAGAQRSGSTMSGDHDQMAALMAAAQNEQEMNKLLFGNAHGPQAF